MTVTIVPANPDFFMIHAHPGEFQYNVFRWSNGPIPTKARGWRTVAHPRSGRLSNVGKRTVGLSVHDERAKGLGTTTKAAVQSLSALLTIIGVVAPRYAPRRPPPMPITPASLRPRPVWPTIARRPRRNWVPLDQAITMSTWLRDQDGMVSVGVHFGSRGLGHTSATKYLKLAGGRDGTNVPPALVDVDTDLGRSYLAAMELAGRYAYAGRDWVVERVRRIIGGAVTHYTHNHHNFAWLEEHGARKLWVACCRPPIDPTPTQRRQSPPRVETGQRSLPQ